MRWKIKVRLYLDVTSLNLVIIFTYIHASALSKTWAFFGNIPIDGLNHKVRLVRYLGQHVKMESMGTMTPPNLV
jgi:hypothetical protein